MVNGVKSLYKDYEILLIKNDKLSKENRKLKYFQTLLESQNKTLRLNEKKAKDELSQKEEIIKQKDYEIARLNMDGTNHGI